MDTLAHYKTTIPKLNNLSQEIIEDLRALLENRYSVEHTNGKRIIYLTNRERQAYLRSCMAYNEFIELCKTYPSEIALEMISDKQIMKRVKKWHKIQGFCLAAFLEENTESLLCAE